MPSNTRVAPALAALLLLVGGAGLGALGWVGARDLAQAEVLAQQVEAELGAVTAAQLELAARLGEDPSVDSAAMDAAREDLGRAQTVEAQAAAASRLAAALSRALASQAAPVSEAEQAAQTQLRFEVVRAQEQVMALRARAAEAQAQVEALEGSPAGRVARGLGL